MVKEIMLKASLYNLFKSIIEKTTTIIIYYEINESCKRANLDFNCYILSRLGDRTEIKWVLIIMPVTI